MAFKEFLIEDVTIQVHKRKGGKSLRVSVLPGGKVRVSIPAWAPYKAGLDFARARLDWIRSQMVHEAPKLLEHGHAVGKAHHLRYHAGLEATKPTSRVTGGAVVVTYPIELEVGDPLVQQVAQKACIRALRMQAEALLPQRLATLAEQHGFDYASVRIKLLKRRWGSCDQHKHIVLNLYLMQLPWDAIDYVILHELTHTQVLHHGPDFWAAMARVLPSVQRLRKTMRQYQPAIMTF